MERRVLERTKFWRIGLEMYLSGNELNGKNFITKIHGKEFGLKGKDWIGKDIRGKSRILKDSIWYNWIERIHFGRMGWKGVQLRIFDWKGLNWKGLNSKRLDSKGFNQIGKESISKG